VATELPRGLRTRLAPTPSGFLHVGNALNFLLTEALADRAGGTILLRIDDLDAERVRPEYVQDIFDSLNWLGISWHEGPRDPGELADHWSQHLRMAHYRDLLAQLREQGALYACDCSRQTMEQCRCITRRLPFDRAEVSWRLRLPEAIIDVPELNGGTRQVELRQVMTDPVLRQRNGRPAYHIASLADDEDFAMDLIVRGEDLLASTALQLHLASLLGLPKFLAARFVHHGLITDSGGRKLSKSAGDEALVSLRSQGKDARDLRARAEPLVEEVLG
jgi:glutamyl-tRNA synthetase